MAGHLKAYWERLQKDVSPSERIEFDGAFQSIDADEFDWWIDAGYDEKSAFERMNLAKRERKRKEALAAEAAKSAAAEISLKSVNTTPSFHLRPVDTINYSDPSWSKMAQSLSSDPDLELTFEDVLSDLKEMDSTARQMWNNELEKHGNNIDAVIFSFGYDIMVLMAANKRSARRERKRLERRVAELEAISHQIASAARQLTALEERINDFADKGVWKPGCLYRKMNIVTDGGSLWIAQRPTEEKPGDGDGWRLAVKRGRDGRDVKPEQIAKHLLPNVLAAIDKK